MSKFIISKKELKQANKNTIKWNVFLTLFIVLGIMSIKIWGYSTALIWTFNIYGIITLAGSVLILALSTSMNYVEMRQKLMEKSSKALYKLKHGNSSIKYFFYLINVLLLLVFNFHFFALALMVELFSGALLMHQINKYYSFGA